jgi:outer membrane PBP1 activator LpoA protein
MILRYLPTLLLVPLITGCGGVPQSQIDAAQQATETALTRWKQGEKPTGFTDEALEKGWKLTAFQILRTEADREKIIRSFVKLTLADRRGKASEIEVAYQVKLEPTVVIARDPYF